MGQPSAQVFISYSHADAVWMQRLLVHLRPLMREETLSVWSDTRIRAGDKWRDQIRTALAEADVVVALVTADFLASEFIMEVELCDILTAAAGEASHPQRRFIPVIVKPSVIGLLPRLEQYQASNSFSEPIAAMNEVDREAAFVKVVEDIVVALGMRSREAMMAEQEVGVLTEARQADGPASVSSELSRADVQFLLAHPLGQWEVVHLTKLASATPYRYVPRGNFIAELDNLLQQNLIERQPGRGRRSAERGGGPNSDLKEHFFVTPDGQRYLELLAQLGVERVRAQG